MERSRNRNASALLAVVALAVPASALGQSGPRVTAPAAAEVAAARPLLDRGLVVVLERDGSGAMKQVRLFGRVNAPQEKVFDVLANPTELPPMQPSMRDIEERARSGNAVTYRWHYSGTIVSLRGSTSMALARPGAVQWILANGFGPGQMLWRLEPDGEQTLVSLTLHVDVTQSSHPIMRWLTRNNPTQLEAWNLGHGIISLRGLQQVAASRAGRKGLPPPTGESGAGPLRPLTGAQIKALGPLLARGTVGLVEQDRSGQIQQATIAEKVAAPPAKVVDLLLTPGRWDLHSAKVNVPGGDPRARRFGLAFSFPAFSVSSDAELTARDDGIDLACPAGRLQGSVATFAVAPDGSGSVLTSASRFRFRKAGAILRRMIDDDPYFGHALNASVLAVWTRSLKQVAEQR